MHDARSLADLPKSDAYAELLRSLDALIGTERNFIANCANFSALIYASLPDLNWAGFYFLAGGQLVLGPFQGKVACVRIDLGRGVCGTAAVRRETVVVPDVHAFPGHIACDHASASEIVVPMLTSNLRHADTHRPDESRLIGVLDLDSPKRDRFDDIDAKGLQRAVEMLLSRSHLPLS
jgi:GAF domain-containing protein